MSLPGRVLAASALLLAALACASPADADPSTDDPQSDRPVFSTVDNRITVSRIFGATGAGHWSRRSDGSIDGTTTKQAYSFTHSDTWSLGANYLDVTLYRSGPNDPAAPCIRAGLRPGQPPSARCPGAIRRSLPRPWTWGRCPAAPAISGSACRAISAA